MGLTFTGSGWMDSDCAVVFLIQPWIVEEPVLQILKEHEHCIVSRFAQGIEEVPALDRGNQRVGLAMKNQEGWSSAAHVVDRIGDLHLF